MAASNVAMNGDPQLWDEMAALSHQPGAERWHLRWRYLRERALRRLGLAGGG